MIGKTKYVSILCDNIGQQFLLGGNTKGFVVYNIGETGEVLVLLVFVL
jgi:hypothetical protein